MSRELEATQRVRLLLGVCGSISGVAVPHLLFWLRQTLAVTQVQVILTDGADHLLGRRSIEAILGHRVLRDWDDVDNPSAPHVALGSWAHVVVILPATANFMFKVAHGVADDLLSATVLATSSPVIIAPAMNAAMLAKPAVQRNLSQLRLDGYEVVNPAAGVELHDGAIEAGSLGDFRPVLVAALKRALIRQGAAGAFDPTVPPTGAPQC